VIIGSHRPFADAEAATLEKFLESRNAVALCGATSAWHGVRRVMGALACAQNSDAVAGWRELKPDLVILIGGTCNDKPVLFECFTEISDERKAWGLRTASAGGRR